MYKIYFGRGRELIHIVQFLMITILFAQIFNDYFNLEFYTFFVITSFSVIFISGILGYMDYRYGIWRAEAEKEASINPFNAQSSKLWGETLKEVSSEKSDLERIQQKLKYINGFNYDEKK